MNTLFEKLWMLDKFEDGGLHTKRVLTTLAKEVDAVDEKIPAGTNVRIVMVSRFGDVGITYNLNETGYVARVGNPRNPGELESWFTTVHFDN